MENRRVNSYTVTSYLISRTDGTVHGKEKMSFRRSRGPDGSMRSELLEHENIMPEEEWKTSVEQMMQHAGGIVSAYLAQHPTE